MLKNICTTIPFLFLVLCLACSREAIPFIENTQPLRFSKDTLRCDTLYNQIRSETYAVKVYNDADRDVLIPKIALENSAQSLYRINVDGKSGIAFHNISLRKRDSLYIFVEIAPKTQQKIFIAEDNILFSWQNTTQKVTLISVVKDAEFFLESTTNPNYLRGNTTWNNNKAKIIQGSLTLMPNATLRIKEGTEILFGKDSQLKITNGAKLIVEGKLGKEVIFRSHRSDARYDTISKNWQGIVAEKSATIKLNYSNIFGGTIGLKLNEAHAELTNTKIYNHHEYGILANNATINASNLIVNHSQNAAVALYNGGNYHFVHSNFVNFWRGAGQALALIASSKAMNDTSNANAMQLRVENSIVYNNRSNAIQLKNTQQNFDYSFQNILLKHEPNSAGFSAETNTNIHESITNQNPLFLNPFIHKMNLRVAQNSPARGRANAKISAQFPVDIAGTLRQANPNIGAYE